MKTITIDPVTRIEGHAKVFLDYNDDGSVKEAGMIVNELRGFERILVGMEAGTMPLITARICGVCPTAHHLAAAKALDAAAGVEPPPAGKMLRELMYMGHFIHSHALHIFVLAGPDLFFGVEADPATKNILGMIEDSPEIAKKALRLRTLGQKINEAIGGRGIHPAAAVVGGISFRLQSDKRAMLAKWIDEALELGVELATVGKDLVLKLVDRYPQLMNDLVTESWYMGTVQNGVMNLYDGIIRAVNDKGELQVEFESKDYLDYIVERPVDWSYMKPVYFKHGGQDHLYRVNTLARLNITDRISTPVADKELQSFWQSFGKPNHNTILHHQARIIELIYVLERAKQLISDDAIMGESRVPATFPGGRGVAHVEAPRGTLIHDYEIDDKGIVRSANLIVATQQNFAAINQTVAQTAQSFGAISGERPALDAVEMGIRCYDPCLSCATHAVGNMPLEVEVRKSEKLITKYRR